MIKKLLKGVMKIFIPKRLREAINNLANLDNFIERERIERERIERERIERERIERERIERERIERIEREQQQQNLHHLNLQRQQNLHHLQNNDYVHNIVCVTPNLTDRKIIKFYCPDYPKDLIQCELVDTNNFFAYDSLLTFNKYIKEGAVILDIGGNIGNHSLYWATVRKAQKIISFEPYPLMYNHFMKHIQMNGLSDIITVYNKALGSENSKATVSYANITNFGGSGIRVSDDGNMEMVTLDSLDLQLDRIDFVKIDVEGFELEVLKGAKQTLLKYKPPTIALEILDFGAKFKELYEGITTLLTELGYVQVDKIYHDYIFKHKDNL